MLDHSLQLCSTLCLGNLFWQYLLPDQPSLLSKESHLVDLARICTVPEQSLSLPLIQNLFTQCFLPLLPWVTLHSVLGFTSPHCKRNVITHHDFPGLGHACYNTLSVLKDMAIDMVRPANTHINSRGRVRTYPPAAQGS